VTVVWERSGDASYATIREPSGKIGFHLIVENNGGLLRNWFAPKAEIARPEICPSAKPDCQ
jgi:hypothetical protein